MNNQNPSIDPLTVHLLAGGLTTAEGEANDPVAQRRHYRSFGLHSAPSIRAIYAGLFPKPFLAEAAMTNDESVEVRSELARSIYTQGANLVHLALDRQVRVKTAVAANPNTPPEALEHLAHDHATGAVRVREAVAGNPSCPPEVLEQLCRDRNRRVVVAAIENPQAPQDLVLTALDSALADEMLFKAILAKVEDPFVQVVAHERSSTQRQQWEEQRQERRRCLDQLEREEQARHQEAKTRQRVKTELRLVDEMIEAASGQERPFDEDAA